MDRYKQTKSAFVNNCRFSKITQNALYKGTKRRCRGKKYKYTPVIVDNNTDKETLKTKIHTLFTENKNENVLEINNSELNRILNIENNFQIMLILKQGTTFNIDKLLTPGTGFYCILEENEIITLEKNSNHITITRENNEENNEKYTISTAGQEDKSYSSGDNATIF